MDTGSFNVRLSWTTENSPTSAKTVIGTVSMTLGGWRNEKTNNRGMAVFNWVPNIPKGKNYYFYVEIDPENAIAEVHEERYRADNTTLNDYGGNNTGFYPFMVYNQGDTDPVADLEFFLSVFFHYVYLLYFSSYTLYCTVSTT